MFWLFLINVDVSLLRQLYSKNTVLFNLTISGNNAFSTMCNVCNTCSNRSSRVQIPWDIAWEVLFVLYWVKLNNYQLLNEVEYDRKSYADPEECYPPMWKTTSEICIIRIKRKPNSIIVLLFIQNISNFLTSLPPRRLSSKLWLIFQDVFRI